MKTHPKILKRFQELEEKMDEVENTEQYLGIAGIAISSEAFEEWANSVLNLLQQVFEVGSVHFQNFNGTYKKFRGRKDIFDKCKGIFKSAKQDYEGGYVFKLELLLSGEIFGDFVALSKKSLKEGYKDIAAVLSCAALEDVLKRFAIINGLAVEDKNMPEVVSALKSKGLVRGAQKSLLDTMPKIRNLALHAKWDKISPEDVNSVIGFVEQFILSHFSE